MNTDLLVVGAGPAGISAALRAAVLELSVRMLDSGAAPGGQLFEVHFHPADVPGFEQGDGAALAEAYARQLRAARVATAVGVAVALRPAAPAAEAAVRLASGETLEAKAVLIATGVRRRRLGVPGESELERRGVTFSATRDRVGLAGRHLAVVGGGDAAFENALLLSAARCEVELLTRGAPRARAEFRARAEADPRIHIHADALVTAINGESEVRSVSVEQGASQRELAVEAVVIKVGWCPNTEWCREAVDLDADGYVRVNLRLETSAAGVWAAGDVTRPTPPSVPVALGQGAQAAALIRSELRG